MSRPPPDDAIVDAKMRRSRKTDDLAKNLAQDQKKKSQREKAWRGPNTSMFQRVPQNNQFHPYYISENMKKGVCNGTL